MNLNLLHSYRRSFFLMCVFLMLIEWQEEWPDSLKEFVQTAFQLSLSRGQVDSTSYMVLHSLPIKTEISSLATFAFTFEAV